MRVVERFVRGRAMGAKHTYVFFLCALCHLVLLLYLRILSLLLYPLVIDRLS